MQRTENFEIGSNKSYSHYENNSSRSRSRSSDSILSVAFRALRAVAQFFSSIVSSISSFFFSTSSRNRIEDYEDDDREEDYDDDDGIQMGQYRNPDGSIEFLPVANAVHSSSAPMATAYYG